MNLPLLEIERQISCSPDQKDRPVPNFAVSFENLKTFPPTIRRILLATRRLVWTVWTYRALVNELDDLAEADFRDLAISPRNASSIAWNEARRQAAQRYDPHRKHLPL